MPHSHCPSLQFLPLPAHLQALAAFTLLSPPPALRGRAEGTGGGGAQGQGVCGGVRMQPLTLVAPPLSAGGGVALWFPEKCLDRGSLKRLRAPTSLGVRQARALGWACGPLPSPPPQPFRAFPECWPTLFTCRPPATLIFQGFLQEAPESPLPALLSWAWHGEWAGCPGEPQRIPTAPGVPRLSPCGSGASPGVSWRDQTQTPFPRGPSWARPARHRRWGGF